MSIYKLKSVLQVGTSDADKVRHGVERLASEGGVVIATYGSQHPVENTCS
jgi:hypothetical protein